MIIFLSINTLEGGVVFTGLLIEGYVQQSKDDNTRNNNEKPSLLLPTSNRPVQLQAPTQKLSYFPFYFWSKNLFN